MNKAAKIESNVAIFQQIGNEGKLDNSIASYWYFK